MSSGVSWQDELQTTTVAGRSTRYWRTGNTSTGAQVLVLHGWGAKIEAVHPIVTGLASIAEVIALDMPGFGETDLPPAVWGIADYADWVLAAMNHFKLQRPSIVGHSFGGKTSIVFAAKYPDRVNRLLLVDASGIKPHRGLDYYAKVYSAKFVKHTAPFLGPLGEMMRGQIANRAASSDYANAGALRPTFVRIVNEHVTSYLPRIKAPTLLIWGEDDTAVPVSDGQLMERLIPDAALIVFEHAGHYAYLDEPGRFQAIAQNFLAVASPTDEKTTQASTESGPADAEPHGRSVANTAPTNGLPQ